MPLIVRTVGDFLPLAEECTQIECMLQRTLLIVATSGPTLSGHNNRWLLYPAVL